MISKIFSLAVLLALACAGTDGKDQSTVMLEKMIENLKAAGKLEGRHEQALTALKEEFPDLVEKVKHENKTDHDLYHKIAEFLRQQNREEPTPIGGYSTVDKPGGESGEDTYPSGTPEGSDGYVPGGTYPGGNKGGTYPGESGTYPGGSGSGTYPGGNKGGTYPGGNKGGTYPGQSGGGTYPGGNKGGTYPGGSDGYVHGGSGDPAHSGGGGYGSGGYVPPKPLNIYEDLMGMMDTIFAIMKFQGLIYDSDNPSWTLIDHGFELLADFVRRNINRNKHHDGECPYSYDQAGESCLAVDLNALGLTWYEARLYCQVMKGGDLAIFRDANQLRDMMRYARSFDKHYRYSYWVGASDERKENDWRFINGEKVPMGTPYWGRTDGDNVQNPSGGDDYDYAILYGKDFFYLADINDEDAEHVKVIPMCQYFPGRGHNSHRGYHSEKGYYHNSADEFAETMHSIFKLNGEKYHRDTKGQDYHKKTYD